MSGTFIRVATLAELRPGTLGRAEVNGRRILLANVDGEILATDEICTHEEASLYRGALHGDCVSCPLHGSRFDLRTGQPLEEPATEPLRTYAVEVRDGEILVCID